MLPPAGELAKPEAVQREDGSWLLDGFLDAHEFTELFELPDLPDQDKGYYQTLGGFVINYLGRIPVAGDRFEWNGLKFEVMDMDGKRVDKVLVLPEMTARGSDDPPPKNKSL